jgi:hypothetical protein
LDLRNAIPRKITTVTVATEQSASGIMKKPPTSKKWMTLSNDMASTGLWSMSTPKDGIAGR